MIYLAKDAEPEFNHEEISGKSKLRDILQNNWIVIFQCVKVVNVKERLKKCVRLKETKEIWQRNETCDFELAHFSVKDLTG